MQLAATLFGHRYQFRDIKELLAKANDDLTREIQVRKRAEDGRSAGKGTAGFVKKRILAAG